MKSLVTPLRRAALLALALAALAAPAPLRAQAEPPPPDTGLQVILLTMGQGDAVWEKFGHNAIWIHDPAAGTDYVYNYGVFDFNSPGYWSRFLKGNWLYELGVSDIGRTMWQYRYLNRSVRAQWLNLTAARKRELQQLLDVNALPQNREYLYDYYRDNCSTRIRDAIDRVTGGRLRAATVDSMTATTYRSHSYRLIADDRASYFGLAGGLGPAADRPISAWEEMFLPFKVEEQVRTVRVPDEAGRLVPLVAREQVMSEAEGRPAERTEPPATLHWFLLGGLALAAALVLFGVRTSTSRGARFGFGALASLWLLFAGTAGVILLALWALTNHQIAYRNENLLQLSPLAIPLLFLVPALTYGARWAAKPARALSMAVAALSLLGFALQLLPGLDQDNGHMMALALPVNLALAWVVRRMAAWAPDRARAATEKRARRPVAA